MVAGERHKNEDGATSRTKDRTQVLLKRQVPFGGAGLPGNIHLAADVLHLIAAAAWVGGLLPLAMMLTAAGKASSFGPL